MTSHPSRSERVDDAIAEWHDLPPEDERELIDYLGWTWSEYKNWMWDGTLPPEREGAV